LNIQKFKFFEKQVLCHVMKGRHLHKFIGCWKELVKQGDVFHDFPARDFLLLPPAPSSPPSSEAAAAAASAAWVSFRFRPVGPVEPVPALDASPSAPPGTTLPSLLLGGALGFRSTGPRFFSPSPPGPSPFSSFSFSIKRISVSHLLWR
jgi:hypothetical protein